MPWDSESAKKHISGLTSEQYKAWAKIANSALSSCIASGKGKGECEGYAIRVANSKSKKVGGEHEMEDELVYSFSIKKFEDVETEEMPDGGLKIKGIPVFETGNHKGKEYTETDIDKIVSQFSPADDIPLQKDHSESSDSTLGYIVNLFRKAKTMFADMVLLDANAITRWKSKLMKKFSISILKDLKLREISAVAFPQVKTARVMSEHEMPKMMITCDGTAEGTKMSVNGTDVKNLGSVSFGADMGSDGMSPYLHCSYEEKKDEKNGFTSRKRYTYNPETKEMSEDNEPEYFDRFIKNYASYAKSIKLNTIEEDDEEMSKELLEEAAEREKALTKEIDTLKTQLAAKDTEIVTFKDKTKADSVDKALVELDKFIAPAKKDEFKKILTEMSDTSRDMFVKTMKESATPVVLDEKGQVVTTKPGVKTEKIEETPEARKVGIDENASIFSDASDLVARAEKMAKDKNIDYDEAYSIVMDEEQAKIEKV